MSKKLIAQISLITASALFSGTANSQQNLSNTNGNSDKNLICEPLKYTGSYTDTKKGFIFLFESCSQKEAIAVRQQFQFSESQLVYAFLVASTSLELSKGVYSEHDKLQADTVRYIAILNELIQRGDQSKSKKNNGSAIKPEPSR